jgi:hypothetical protein
VEQAGAVARRAAPPRVELVRVARQYRTVPVQPLGRAHHSERQAEPEVPALRRYWRQAAQAFPQMLEVWRKRGWR